MGYKVIAQIQLQNPSFDISVLLSNMDVEIQLPAVINLSLDI